MKRLLLILICLFLSFEVKSKNEDILCKSLTESDDFFYKKFSTKKFSGNCVEFSENGQIIEKRKIKGGVLLKSERFNIVDKVPSVLSEYTHEHRKIHHITDYDGIEIPVYLRFDKCESDFKNNSEFKKCKILLNKKIELDRYYCDNEMLGISHKRCENILKLQLEFESKLIDNVLVYNITKYEYCKLGYKTLGFTRYSVENEVECFKVEEYFSSKKSKLCKPLENVSIDSGMSVSFRCDTKFDPLGCDRRYLKVEDDGRLLNKRKDQKMLCDPEGVRYCEPESFDHLMVDDTTCKKEKSLHLYYGEDEKGKKSCVIWDDLIENDDERVRFSEICKYKKEVKSWKKNNF